MIKGDDGQWHEASWQDALKAVALGLNKVLESSGASQIGSITTEYATLEEMSLLSRLTRALGSENIDSRLRQSDAGLDAVLSGVPWLGMAIADLDTRDRVLVVGSFLRKDHPLMAQRLRQAAKRGTQVCSIDIAGDDPLIKLTARSVVAPNAVAHELAQVAVALAQLKGADIPAALAGVQAGPQAQRIAQSLSSAQQGAVLLGNAAVNSSDAAQIAANAQLVAQLSGATLGFLTQGANTVGAYLAGAVPAKGGKNAASMFAQPLKSYIVLHAEPLLDVDNGAQALAALKSAQFNVALTPFADGAGDWAHVMLPVAPFTETAGTFVNAQGLAQSFKGTAQPYGQSRPAWKVLRVMGNVLHLAGFDDESSESVRDAVLANGIESKLSNGIHAQPAAAKPQAVMGLQRVTDVPIYRTDALVRRSEPLQATEASRPPVARMSAETLGQLGLAAGQRVRLKSARGAVELACAADPGLSTGTVRVSAGFEMTAALGSASAHLQVERA